jgi:hypothetical protein
MEEANLMPNLRQTVALAVLASWIALPASASPATSNKVQNGTGSSTVTVPEDRATAGSSSEPLSDKLDRSGGVIRPPRGIDPGMTQAPPHVGSKSTPVIPPPGAKPGVNPK